MGNYDDRTFSNQEAYEYFKKRKTQEKDLDLKKNESSYAEKM